MGWAVGHDHNWKRWIGYGVPAYCDSPNCHAEIDRGLAYVCGAQQPYGGENGCGLYFCGKHLFFHQFRGGDFGEFCKRCIAHKPPYQKLSPEHPDWVNHLLTDESWERWRNENPDEVASLLQH